MPKIFPLYDGKSLSEINELFVALSFKLDVAFRQLAHSKDFPNSRSSWPKPRLILVDNMSGDCLYSMEEDLSQDSGLVVFFA